VAGWPKLAEGESKSGDTVKFESRRDLAMATPREGFPFYSSTERNGDPNRLGRDLRSDPVVATRGSIMVGL
jgi:hypothetical protein